MGQSRFFVVLGAVGALTLALASPADAALKNASDSLVTFIGYGPGGLRIEGKTTELTVSEDTGKVKFTVPLAKLETGIELRNRHTRDKYLEVAKYPNAELVVDRAAIKFPGDGAEVSGTAPGQMTIKGQTKPLSVNYTAKRSGTAFDISGTAKINIKDYGIEIPSYLGVTVKPDVDLTLKSRVQDVQ